MSVFVDTSVWYAAVDSSDIGNTRAKAILTNGEPLVTSDHVLVETWTLLRFRINRHTAERFWEGLRGGNAAVETVGPADMEAAWQIASSTATRGISHWSIAQASQSCADWVLTASRLLTTTLPSFVLARSAATLLPLSADLSTQSSSFSVRGEIEACNFANL